jgi:hypothetical protein
VKARAVDWYGKALPTLAGFTKAKVEKRLGGIEPTTTPPPPSHARSSTALRTDPARKGLIKSLQAAVDQAPTTRLSGIVLERTVLKGLVVIEKDTKLQGGVELIPSPGAVVINLSYECSYLPTNIPDQEPPFISISFNGRHTQVDSRRAKSVFRNCIFYGVFVLDGSFSPDFENCAFFGVAGVSRGSYRGNNAQVWNAHSIPGQFKNCLFSNVTFSRLSPVENTESCAFKQCGLTAERQGARIAQVKAWDTDGLLAKSLDTALYRDEKRLRIVAPDQPCTVPFFSEAKELEEALAAIAKKHGAAGDMRP